MKAKIIYLSICCLLPNIVTAQLADSAQTDFQQEHLVSLGYDFRKLFRLNSGEGFGPLFLKYERKVKRNIGIGGATYFQASKNYSELEQFQFPNGDIIRSNEESIGFSVMPKINWHFNMNSVKNPRFDKLDIYAGVGIGYGYERYRIDYLTDYQGTFSIYNDRTEINHFVATEFNVGLRFQAFNNFGGYCEAGFGISNVQVGIFYNWN